MLTSKLKYSIINIIGGGIIIFYFNNGITSNTDFILSIKECDYNTKAMYKLLKDNSDFLVRDYIIVKSVINNDEYYMSKSKVNNRHKHIPLFREIVTNKE